MTRSESGHGPSRRSRRARSFGAAAALLTALLLAGCTSTGSSGSAVDPAEPPSVSNEAADSGGGKVPAGGTTTDVKNADRDVITTGSVSITVADPITAAADAVTITEQAGGRVDSRNETPGTPNQPAHASLSLRIPAEELTRTVAEVKKLGTVNFVSLNASDVTAQSTDLDARITALQTSVDRLLALMAQANSTTDLITIEDSLSSRQADLESLQSQRTYLSDQIDYSTIGLDLFAEGVVAPGSPDDFWTGIAAGWNALVATFGGMIVGLGVALPWIGALAVLAGIVLLIVWLSTRKGKAA